MASIRQTCSYGHHYFLLSRNLQSFHVLCDPENGKPSPQVPTTISDRSKSKDILWFLRQYPGECMADAMLLNLISMLLLRPMIRKTDGVK